MRRVWCASSVRDMTNPRIHSLIHDARESLDRGAASAAVRALGRALDLAVVAKDAGSLRTIQPLIAEAALLVRGNSELQCDALAARAAAALAQTRATADPGYLEARLDDFGARIVAMREDLEDLRAEVLGGADATAEVGPAIGASRGARRTARVDRAPEAALDSEAPPRLGETADTASSEAAAPSVSKPFERARGTDATGVERVLARSLGLIIQRSWASLLTSKSLAWAGGAVTLLGIALLFLLAIDRGLLGPEARLALGGTISVALLAGGAAARRRFGSLVAGLALAGVGLAGSYVTLAASAAVYGFVPVPVALLVAFVLASAAALVALRWESQLVAGFGLVGGMVVLPIIEQGFTPLVGVFLTLLFAASASVATWQRWRPLLTVAAIASLVQVVGVVGFAALSGTTGSVSDALLLAASLWLLLTASGLAWQLRANRRGSEPASIALILAGVTLAGYASAVLLSGDVLGVSREGIALLCVAAVQVTVGVLVVWRFSARRLASPLWASGLAVGAVAAGELLSGASLTLAWSAQAVLLGWLSGRLSEPRLRLASLAYLALAVGNTVLIDSPPRNLFQALEHPAAEALGIGYAAAAALLIALFVRTWDVAERGRGLFVTLGAALSASTPHIFRLCRLLAALLALYGASLAALEATQWLGGSDVAIAFNGGQVLVTAMWSVLLVLVAGLARDHRALLPELLLAMGLLLAKVTLFDLGQLADDRWPVSACVAGLALLTAGIAWAVPRSRSYALDLTTLLPIMASLGLLLGAVVGGVEGTWSSVSLEGLALVGVAAIYGGSRYGRASANGTLRVSLGCSDSACWSPRTQCCSTAAFLCSPGQRFPSR